MSCVATKVIYERAFIYCRWNNLQIFKNRWKFNTYTIGRNAYVKKLSDLDALVFLITNRLIHKYHKNCVKKELK